MFLYLLLFVIKNIITKIKKLDVKNKLLRRENKIIYFLECLFLLQHFLSVFQIKNMELKIV